MFRPQQKLAAVYPAINKHGQLLATWVVLSVATELLPGPVLPHPDTTPTLQQQGKEQGKEQKEHKKEKDEINKLCVAYIFFLSSNEVLLLWSPCQGFACKYSTLSLSHWIEPIVWIEMNLKIPIFKASALWADAFYKSKCLSVCPSVCLCICSLLRYRLTVFLPPLPEVGCPIFLEIQNPWGKVMERSGFRYEHFCLKIV